MKRIKHTVATYAHLLASPQWTLVDAELDAGTELDATARRLDLGCAQRESGSKAWVRRSTARGAGDARQEQRDASGGTRHEVWVGRARHEAQGARGTGAGGSVLSDRDRRLV